MTWHDIKYAPKDGSQILVAAYVNTGTETGWALELVEAHEDEFDGGDWGIARSLAPFSHWCAIPKPPETTQ